MSDCLRDSLERGWVWISETIVYVNRMLTSLMGRWNEVMLYCWYIVEELIYEKCCTWNTLFVHYFNSQLK